MRVVTKIPCSGLFTMVATFADVFNIPRAVIFTFHSRH